MRNRKLRAQLGLNAEDFCALMGFYFGDYDDTAEVNE